MSATPSSLPLSQSMMTMNSASNNNTLLSSSAPNNNNRPPQVKLDPYEVLNLPREYFTMDQLKANYRRLAAQLHTGTTGSTTSANMSKADMDEVLRVLTACYKLLLPQAGLVMTGGGGSIVEGGRLTSTSTRSNNRGGTAVGGGGGGVGGGSSSRALDPAKFNKVFEGQFVRDAFQSKGYGDHMASSEDGVLPSLRGETATGITRRGARREDPEPVCFQRGGNRSVSFYELGVDDVDDFGKKDVAVTRHGIAYTDYQVAHTTSALMDPDDFESCNRAVKSYKSLDEFEAARTTRTLDPLTREEMDIRERETAMREMQDARRRQFQAQVDRTMTSSYKTHTEIDVFK